LPPPLPPPPPSVPPVESQPPDGCASVPPPPPPPPSPPPPSSFATPSRAACSVGTSLASSRASGLASDASAAGATRAGDGRPGFGAQRSDVAVPERVQRMRADRRSAAATVSQPKPRFQETREKEKAWRHTSEQHVTEGAGAQAPASSGRGGPLRRARRPGRSPRAATCCCSSSTARRPSTRSARSRGPPRAAPVMSGAALHNARSYMYPISLRLVQCSAA